MTGEQIDTVLVTCESGSHKGLVVNLLARDPTGRWSVANLEGLKTKPNVTSELIVQGLGPRNLLDRQTRRSKGGQAYERFRLECPRCHYTLVLRDTRLFEILDTVAKNNIGTITLAALGGIVRDS